ncbi:hypothetical protein AB0892_20205 [Streptomyces sp. NPDC005409]|uniref:hypothetical protein n=1 Tax=Streptomyces sp. NPDC005409 TaxID=3155342 RepID=UPI003453BB9B
MRGTGRPDSAAPFALAWTLGALINLVNGRLTAAGSPMLLCTDTAWYLRHGVDTEQALHLLTSGITSRRLPHQIGRLAHEESISTSELRPWLTSHHIDGWLTLFDASAYEVVDLLEYVRSRSGNVLNTVMEGGQARLKVSFIEGLGAPSGPVVIGHLEGSTALVLLLQDQPVAIIPASSHSDMAALQDSYLATELTLAGDELTIRLSASEYPVVGPTASLGRKRSICSRRSSVRGPSCSERVGIAARGSRPIRPGGAPWSSRTLKVDRPSQRPSWCTEASC